MTPKELALADLARSGLGIAEAKALKLEALGPREVSKIHTSFKRAPSLKIPYFDLAGKPTKFFRLRYLELNGVDRLARKPMRYAQLPGTAPEVYFPPLGGFDWRVLAKATDRAILITEGEKKAAAATAAGFPTIGLGGVWSWKSKKRGIGLVSALRDEISWKERKAYFVFDSDYKSKPDVAAALTALAGELGALGAKPFLVALPELEDGGKTGLDDFLVARGRAALAAALVDAEPFSMLEELWKLNTEVVYVRSPGIIIVHADGRKLAPASFKEHAYSNRYYYERTVDAKGNERLAKKPAAPAWLAWEQRAELARLTYAPGAPHITEAGEANLWRGWGCEPKRGDVAPWRKLLDYVFADDADARRWFESWCAHPLQNPGAKLYSACLVWGVKHGTGKSLIGLSLARIYGANATIVNDQHLASSFNEWAEAKQFVIGDDVMSGEHRSRLAVADRLKAMVTQETIRINQKYVPSYEVPDRINYYFTSNHPDAFFLEDTDRRYFVWEAPTEPLALEFYHKVYDPWLRSDAGPPALFEHLLGLDTSGFNPKAPAPETAAKLAMIADSKSDVGSWCFALRENPDAVLKLGAAPIAGDLFTNTQLLRMYDPDGTKRVTANGLGRELKRAGFRQVNGGAVVLTAHGPQRLYAIRNPKRWLKTKPDAVGKEYNKQHEPVVPAERKKDGA